MPRYWILCMSEDNYEIAKQQALIGMAERKRRVMQKITTGDMLTFYISKKAVDSRPNDPAHKVQQFRGSARVTSEVFESNELIWHIREGEIFPHRRKVEFLADASADVRPLINKLAFVTNSTFWALPFQKGYVEISATDFATIQAAIGAPVEAGR